MPPADDLTRQSWSSDWTVGVRLWVDRGGKTILGEGRADLLEAIGLHRSITKAAKSLGMSYRRAWNLVQEINDAAGEPLVEAAAGGLQGGGAQLTDRGRYAVGVYRQLHGSLAEHAAASLRRVVASSHAQVSTPCLHIAAAISLQEALGQILSAFALRRPLVRVRAVYGASNELAEHLLAGAPGDLFISAEASDVDKLERAERIVADTRRVVAGNGLTVIGGPKAPPVMRIADLLQPRFRSVVLADAACPLGRYTKTFLEHAGVYDPLLLKTIHVDSSRSVLAAIASGVAEAGIAFSSDAAHSADCVTLLNIPRSRASAEYVGAVVTSAASPGDAQAMLDFFSTREARHALRRCGFRPAANK